MQTINKSRREPLGFLWKIASVVILCGLTYQLFQCVIYPLLQRDYVIVENNSPQQLEKVTVSFGCNVPQVIVFENIEAGSVQSKPGNRQWGKCDSSRVAKAEGRLSNGQHVGPKTEYSSSSTTKYMFAGDRFKVVINENGSLTLPQY